MGTDKYYMIATQHPLTGVKPPEGHSFIYFQYRVEGRLRWGSFSLPNEILNDHEYIESFIEQQKLTTK